MRTTLTLDEDVTAAVEKLRKTRGQSLKEIINEALRRGLKQMGSNAVKRKRFQTESVTLGRCKIGSLDNVAEALALAESESFK